jgi:hypothetical protein
MPRGVDNHHRIARDPGQPEIAARNIGSRRRMPSLRDPSRPRPIWGIENRVEPEPVVTGNAYDRKYPARLALPRTLWDAAQRLKSSKMARDWFSDAFVEHFAATREWEEREFRKHISDWELARYFEII